MHRLRIAFFGLPLAGYLLLEDGHELCAVALSPVAGPGRRRLRQRLEQGGGGPITDLLEHDVTDAPLVEAVRRAKPDLVVSWFWTRRLPADVLAVPPQGSLGAHPSLLPRHRGPNPYYAAIDAGDRETGVTVHRLVEQYDVGAIIAQDRLPVGDSDAWQLARRLDRLSLRLLRQCVLRIARGEELPERPQEPRGATWAPEPSGDALRVDWNWPTERVVRRIRALAPVPGLALEVSDVEFFVQGAARAPNAPVALEPGEAVVVGGSDPRVLVKTGDGVIRLTRVELTNREETVVVTGSELARRLGPSPALR